MGQCTFLPNYDVVIRIWMMILAGTSDEDAAAAIGIRKRFVTQLRQGNRYPLAKAEAFRRLMP